jgi:hypothetical protein
MHEFAAGVRSERTGQSHFSALAVDGGEKVVNGDIMEHSLGRMKIKF